MRVDVLKSDRLRLVRSAAALAVVAFAGGCSADVARFDDGFYTGAVPHQAVPRADVGGGQAYPGGIDRVNTGSVGGDGRQPHPGPDAAYGGSRSPQRTASLDGGVNGVRRPAGIERSMLAPPTEPSAPAMNEASRAPDAPAMRPPAAARPSAQEAPIPASAMKAGWNNTGTSVTLRQGETIDTLAKRFGVPAKAILSANGMKDAGGAEAGRKIVIPAYSYGASPSAGRTAGARPAGGDKPFATGSEPLHASSGGSAGRSRQGSVVVASGDSLTGIARRSGVSAEALRSANAITGDNIRIGQTLVLPKGASEPKQVAALDAKPVKPGLKPAAAAAADAKAVAAAQPKPYLAPHAESAKPAEPTPAPAPVAAKAETPATSVEAETESEVATAAPAGTGIDQFRWPVQGRVTSHFGDKSGARRSDGLDISVPRGTPVKAAENGVVIYAGDGLKEFGNTILVKHDNGLVTVYGHADDLKVKRGQTVRRGEEIATAGMSGDTDTPMVHFEVRKNSAPVDPMKFLR